MTKKTHFRFGLMAAFLVLAVGCGQPQPPAYGSIEGKEIAKLVEELNEARAHPKQFEKMFSGKAPSNWKRFNEFQFDVDGSPSISNENATARVRIRSENDGSEKGVKEWTFIKEGSNWKIKSADLP
jgi:hypothetical protein